ncbi:MAG TPA: alpha/beta hydrolase [Acidimicrobiales bacterium]|nr:alpha/beta hydrolase [Acidimicrobiales bacterium]
MGASGRFASFDGLEIAYEVIGEELPGRAVLLHHGFASTSELNWRRPGLANALAEAGRRVVLVDARGHGRSDHPHDPAAYGGHAMARDVTALLDHLGLDSVDMAGYSMGAFVTIQVAGGAAGEPERRLRSIFLGGVGLGGVQSDRDRAFERIAEALEAEDASTITDRSALAFRNFADASRQDRLALAAIQRARAPLEAGLIERIRLPALVVNGSADTLAGDPAAVAAHLERARSLVVPGDHLSAVVTAEFKAALVDWACAP